MSLLKHLHLLFLLVIFASCKNETKTSKEAASPTQELQLKYADGFSVSYFEDYTVLTIKKPWPEAEKEYTYVLTDSGKANNTLPNATTIKSSIKRLVVTSTTHIPALELLKKEKALVGFPGTAYISSKKTRSLIDEGHIRELGKNESINTEVLLELNPDVVIGFGVEGVNKTFETIKKANIPVIYNGDWVESSPLAKAEWIKFFGVLFNKEKEADSIFSTIESNYLQAKSLAKQATSRPTVLSGAMHKDMWYLPRGSSPEAQFMEDANLNYLWQDTQGNGSLALSFEVVYDKAKEADLWLSPSYYNSLEQLRQASELYANFKAYNSGAIYSFSNTVGETGGVLYYEMGTARPDLILKDLIKIGHPELLQDYDSVFFKPLD